MRKAKTLREKEPATDSEVKAMVGPVQIKSTQMISILAALIAVILFFALKFKYSVYYGYRLCLLQV